MWLRTISREGVLGQGGVAGVVESIGESPREPNKLIELVEGEHSGVLESWPGDVSMTNWVPKKSRRFGQAGGILISGSARGKRPGTPPVRRHRRG
jgi:hypothetical protein